jgi:hypothetical protein
MCLWFPHPDEICYRPVVGPLKLLVEKAGGQFPAFSVVMKALAAFIFSRAGVIGTVADLLVLLGNTLHGYLLFTFRSQRSVLSIRIIIAHKTVKTSLVRTHAFPAKG